MHCNLLFHHNHFTLAPEREAGWSKFARRNAGAVVPMEHEPAQVVRF